jgi:ATP-dependent helicase/nuclease subunit A
VEIEREFRKAEALRLRYVAATRAGAATIVTQRCKQNSHNPWCHFEPFLGSGCDLPDPRPQAAPAVKRVPLDPVEVEEAAAVVASRLAAARQATYDVRGAKEYALSHPTVEEDLGVVSAAGGTVPPALREGEHGVEWGEVIHLLLQAASEDPDIDLERIASAALGEAGLDPVLAPDAAALARSVTASPIWRRAHESGALFTEVPFQVLREEEVGVPTVLRGVIDLVFKEDGGWVLVDYKTDRAAEGMPPVLARGYAAQVRLYAEAWERCTGEVVKKAFLYFVAADKLVEVEKSGETWNEGREEP